MALLHPDTETRAYEIARPQTQAEIRMERARRGEPMDAEELRCLYEISEDRQPADDGGACLALSIRRYIMWLASKQQYAMRDQGRWALDRIGAYTMPMHRVMSYARDAEDGCTNLIRAAECPTDAEDALKEARDLFEQARAKVQAAIAVVNGGGSR